MQPKYASVMRWKICSNSRLIFLTLWGSWMDFSRKSRQFLQPQLSLKRFADEEEDSATNNDKRLFYYCISRHDVIALKSSILSPWTLLETVGKMAHFRPDKVFFLYSHICKIPNRVAVVLVSESTSGNALIERKPSEKKSEMRGKNFILRECSYFVHTFPALSRESAIWN